MSEQITDQFNAAELVQRILETTRWSAYRLSKVSGVPMTSLARIKTGCGSSLKNYVKIRQIAEQVLKDELK